MRRKWCVKRKGNKLIEDDIRHLKWCLINKVYDKYSVLTIFL